MESFIFYSQRRAKSVLEQMRHLIDWYGVASRADIKDILGLYPKPEDQKVGWYDLSKATVESTDVTNRFVLSLPKPLPLAF